jgi:PAS domain S-box-containing protein
MSSSSAPHLTIDGAIRVLTVVLDCSANNPMIGAPSVARLEALVRVQRLLSATLDPTLVAQRITDSLRELLSARVCTVFRTGEREEDLYGLAVSGDGGPDYGANIGLLGGTGAVGLAVRERRPIATPNVLTDPRIRFEADVRERLASASFRAALAVPLVVRDRLIGALGVGDVEGRLFNADERELTEAFAAQAAQALETARLYDEARRGQREAEIVSGLVSGITASLDLGTVLQRVVEGAKEICAADMVRIGLREPGSPLIAHRIGVGPAGFEARLRPAVGVGEGSGGIVLATGVPFRTEDFQADPRLADYIKESVRGLGTMAHLVVPIRTGARIDGLIYVSRFTRRPFTERDETQLGRLADHAAIAIDNARLHLESEQRRHAAEELAASARVLAESLDPAAVGERVVNGLLALLHAKSASVRRLEPDGSLVAMTWAGRALAHNRGPGHRTRPGLGGIHQAVTRNQAVWSRDLLAEPEVVITDEARAMLLASGDRATLAVPLRAKGAVIGVLTVSDDVGREYSVEEVSLAQAFADQAAVALENARLFIAEQSARVEAQGALAALAESERALATLIGNLPGYTYRCANEPGYALQFISEGVQTITGYRAHEYLVDGTVECEELIHPDDRDGVWTIVQDAVAAGKPYQCSYRIMARSGDEKWVWEQGAGVFAPSGALLCLEGFITDITPLKRAEAALGESEERYRDLVENASDAVFTLDARGRFTAINAAGERLTGYGRDELLVMGIDALLSADDLERADRQIAEAIRPAMFECELLARDGHRVRIEISARGVLREGQRVAVHGIARDVTERHRQEDELRQAQKMEAIGRLAGGIAHDFNNLLTVIGGRAELLLARLPQGRARNDATLVKETAERAAALTRQLLAFSRRQVMQPSVLDLRTVITSMETLLRRLLGEDVDLLIELPAHLTPVRADRSQLEQVVMNLAVNAREAMPRGGRLTIAATEAPDDPAPHVRLTVTDTGHGMDAETQARIFEPFFTTKGAIHGTGLGLATVYGIVTQSGGRIAVDSILGEGTTFSVFLPSARDAMLDSPEAEPGHGTRGTESVLLVEDEPAVRDLAYDVLTSLGYRVLLAGGAEEGVRVMRSQAEPIDLVLTDVVMPDGSGREMVDRLRGLRTDFKVLYMSGYTDDVVIQRGLVTADVAFLQKPFTPAGLAQRVREVLDTDAGTERP